LHNPVAVREWSSEHFREQEVKQYKNAKRGHFMKSLHKDKWKDTPTQAMFRERGCLSLRDMMAWGWR